MKNTPFKLASVGLITVALSGCSLIFTDHTNDYQEDLSNQTDLQVPPGSLRAKDDLVIPNADSIPNLVKGKGFVVPRAPFIFYPMTNIPVSQDADRMTFTVPADLAKTKEMVKSFLSALHGQGDSIATESDERLVSVPFEFIKQGFWASVGSTFTRNFPEKTVFLFTFKASGTNTILTMQYKQQEQGDDVTKWQSPTQDDSRYTDAIRLWGNMGKQLNEASAYLSQRNENTPFPIWVDHRGVFAVRLESKDALASQVQAAGLHFVDGQKNVLAINGHSNKAVDAASEQTTFPYHIEHQKAGDFLVIDVSDVKNPEMTSFQLAQRFVSQ